MNEEIKMRQHKIIECWTTVQTAPRGNTRMTSSCSDIHRSSIRQTFPDSRIRVEVI
jgi:hypothetical protein